MINESVYRGHIYINMYINVNEKIILPTSIILFDLCAAPYGIFARSCVAMAKDSKSTFQIIDDEGCPVDPTIFPGFSPEGNALQSVYEAFRFTESYGVIFQCNVKYCLGPCEPVMISFIFTAAD